MAIMRFNTKVKYNGKRYEANTDVVVGKADIEPLKALGGFIFELPKEAEKVVQPEEVAQPEPVEEVAKEKEPVEEVEKQLVFDPNAKKESLIEFAASIGLAIPAGMKKDEIIKEIEKVI